MAVELRKIQVTGGSTHIISLPKKWVDRNGLGRSDALALHEEPDGSLLVVPNQDGRPRHRRIVIAMPDAPKEQDVVRRLVGAYLAGADEIHLQSKGRMDPAVRQMVRNAIRDLVGVEILDETADSLTLQDLVGVSEMDLRKTVTRMHRIARIMFDDALTAVAEKNHSLALDVTGRDDELDRMEWHVSKQMHALLEQPRLAARMQIRPAEALNFYMIARTLERMGDHASKICKNVANLGTVPANLMDALLDQAKVVSLVWDDAFAALKKDDYERGSGAVDGGKSAGPWRSEFSDALQDAPAVLVGPLTLVADSIDRVRSYAIDIAEVAMNQTFQKAAITS